MSCAKRPALSSSPSGEGSASTSESESEPDCESEEEGDGEGLQRREGEGDARSSTVSEPSDSVERSPTPSSPPCPADCPKTTTHSQ